MLKKPGVFGVGDVLMKNVALLKVVVEILNRKLYFMEASYMFLS